LQFLCPDFADEIYYSFDIQHFINRKLSLYLMARITVRVIVSHTLLRQCLIRYSYFALIDLVKQVASGNALDAEHQVFHRNNKFAQSG